MSSEFQKTVVIGLGGSGTDLVFALQDSEELSGQHFHFDYDSDVFDGLFHGFVSDVYPSLSHWVSVHPNRRCYDSWFNDPRLAHHPPIRDIPDLFMRNATRPAMRAGLLVHIRELMARVDNAIKSAEKVVLVASTFGRTGSAWISDLALAISTSYPSVEVKMLLMRGFRGFNHRADMFRDYWTLREIFSDEKLSQSAYFVFSRDGALAVIQGQFAEDCSEELHREWQWNEDLYPELKRAPLDFHRERSRTISETLTSHDRAALSGLLLAHAEARVDEEAFGLEIRDLISFRSRFSGDQMRVETNSPYEGPGSSLVRLALSHRLLGPDTHTRAYDQLAEEALSVLSGVGPRLEIETHTNLREIHKRIEDRIGLPDKSSAEAALVLDLYPVLHDLVDQMLVDAE
mgnify:CR=1 FL=1